MTAGQYFRPRTTQICRSYHYVIQHKKKKKLDQSETNFEVELIVEMARTSWRLDFRRAPASGYEAVKSGDITMEYSRTLNVSYSQ